MLTKYAIDYIVLPQHNTRVFTHFTDDPVEAEDFLMHLLVARSRLIEIRHNGTVMPAHQSDRMIKLAAERIAAAMLRESLAIDPSEAKARFGFAV